MPVLHEKTRPFGAPACRAGAAVTILPLDEAVSPVALFRRLGPRPDAMLFESAAWGGPAGKGSLVLPSAVLRLVLRGGDAVYEPLGEEASPLLAGLAARLPGAVAADGRRLRARLPLAAEDPSRADEERLVEPGPLDAVRALAGLVEDAEGGPARPPGAYGAISYEIVDRWESLPPRRRDGLDEPDAVFLLALDAIEYDHLRGEVRIVTRWTTKEQVEPARHRHRVYLEAARRSRSRPSHEIDGPAHGGRRARRALPVETDTPDAVFCRGVRRFLEHIRAGDIFQGVLSRGLRLRSRAAPLEVYDELRRRNPSPYMFYLPLPDGVLFGASPETFLKVDGGEIEIRPIAGTAPRGFGPDGGIDAELDARLAVGLLLDAKEQAEHAMLLDLARNDVARVSVPGTRRVVDPFTIEKYSHVQHLVSRVRGTLRPGLDALHAYRATANMGTLTGAPKLRAMELIRETELSGRGFYGGAVGYLLQDGTFDSCIVIRSLRHRAGVYATRAGAGIVADSVPEKELAETEHKARACLEAVAAAEERVR